jgi:hypothetical protein
MYINIVQLVSSEICVYHVTKFDCCTVLCLDSSLDTRRYDAVVRSFCAALVIILFKG